MQYFNDFDIINLVEYSYMNISNANEYSEYKEEVEEIIKQKVLLKDTKKYISLDEKAKIVANFDNINKCAHIKDLLLVGHINDDEMNGNINPSGLVAYAFKCEINNIIVILCRGSEQGVLSFRFDINEFLLVDGWKSFFKSLDWRDNFNMLDNTSIQFEPLDKFYNEIKKKFGDELTKYYAIGHSKGGGLALYLGGIHREIKAISLDGVGLPVETFYNENKNFRLNLINKDKCINKKAANDIVSCMLVHFELCQPLEMVNSFLTNKNELVFPNKENAYLIAHYPQAIFVDKLGNAKIDTSYFKAPTITTIVNNILMARVAYKKLPTNLKRIFKKDLKEFERKSFFLLYNL